MRILSKPDPSWFHRDEVREPHVRLRYLGTAGFVIENDERAIVLDPYVSRSSLFDTVAKPLISDEGLVRKWIPRADDVFVGHAHYDHILDAPTVCRTTGARLIGSRATCMVGRAAGLPDSQMLETSGREDIASGDWTVRGIPSLHGKVLFGRVTLPGDITSPPPWPPRLRDLRHGQVLNWWIDTGSIRIVHVDSADVIDDELRGLSADVVCLCAIGRRYRPNYVRDVVEILAPKVIVPCHWDTMITRLDEPCDLLPTVDLPGFLDEIRSFGVEPRLVPLLSSLGFPKFRERGSSVRG